MVLFQKCQTLAFRFQPIWGLFACARPEFTIFPLNWGPSSCRTQRNVSDCFTHPLQRNQDPAPSLCFCFVFFSFPSSFYYFLIVISPIQFFLLLYSRVTQLHIHAQILFSHIIMLHHKWLDRVPRATQQDLIANPFQGYSLHLLTPSSPTIPLPPPPPWQPQVYSASPWFSFLWKGSFVPYIRFQI